MVTIEKDDFRLLQQSRPGLCVSIFMPTHRGGAEARQDPIRFRNLINQAEGELVRRGLRPPDARHMLEPLSEKATDDAFWMRPSGGLAAYVCDGFCKTLELPSPVDDLVVVGQRFHLLPIQPLAAADDRFFILALSQNEVHLYEADHSGCQEVPLTGTFKSIDELLQYYEPPQVVRTPTSRAGGARFQRGGVFHGHSGQDKAGPKTRDLEFCQMVESAIARALNEERAPLVLAATEPMAGLYRKVNSYPHLHGQGLPGNPDRVDPLILHSQAMGLLGRVLASGSDQAAASCRLLAGTQRAAVGPQHTLDACCRRQVDVLLLAKDTQVWGRYDPKTGLLEKHDQRQPDDDELLDLAAHYARQAGAVIHLLPLEQMPDQAPMAATFRFVTQPAAEMHGASP